MKNLFLLCLLLITIATGCSQNHFNIPTENFAEKVRVFGVVPIMVDANSDIKFPQKDLLITLLTETNRKYEQQLVRKLKATGDFYTIALLDGDAQSIFNKLYSRSEKRDDASILYNKYFWKSDELRDYIQRNNLDAALLIVVSGLTKTDKVMSISQLKSLTSDYNFLIMTAQIVNADGAILWEYPNFRQHFPSYEPLINLEYPDFTEAEANMTSSTDVKFKTIEGIRRSLEQKRKDLLLRETQEPEIYGNQFDEMISLLKYDPDKDKKNSAPANETPRPNQSVEPQGKSAPGVTPVPQAPVTSPSTAPASTVNAPASQIPVMDKPVNPADEIVPAKGSTN